MRFGRIPMLLVSAAPVHCRPWNHRRRHRWLPARVYVVSNRCQDRLGHSLHKIVTAAYEAERTLTGSIDTNTIVEVFIVDEAILIVVFVGQSVVIIVLVVTA